MTGDVLSVEDDEIEGAKLLVPVMRGGHRLSPSPALSDVRAHARRELERLPAPLKQLETGAAYPVQIADKLVCLAAAVDRRLQLPTCPEPRGSTRTPRGEPLFD
jgi:nicotinate phosphoribosyltransferase